MKSWNFEETNVKLNLPFKQLPEALLGDSEGEVAAVEDLHLGHGLLVGLLLGVRPVHDDITAPDFDAASPQTSEKFTN